MNRRRVLEAIREGRSVTRADIARSTGLARSTVSTLVTELQKSGLVVEREISTAGGATRRSGRPPTVLTVDPRGQVVLGIHFDHPYVRVVVADMEHRILAEATQALDIDTAGTKALDEAVVLARGVCEEAQVDESQVIGAGVALAAPIESGTTAVATSGILPGWQDVAVADELSARLDGLPVHVDNDANLGALGEAVLGAGRGANEMAYVMVASGIGCGLVLDGQIYRGAAGTAGEIGHVLVDEQGPMCRCGNRGCLETFAGGDALVDLLRRSHGEEITLERIVELANAGDPGSVRAINDAGLMIGRSVAALCNTLGLDRIVVGGELATAGAALLDPLREAARRYALPSVSERVEIVEGELHGRAELLGAVVLVMYESSKQPRRE